MPLEIMVCPGEDGAFTLYEDAGDGYGYEQGEFTLIPFTWRDKEGVLEIGVRQGGYPGMMKERLMKLRRINGQCVEINYTGAAVSVAL